MTTTGAQDVDKAVSLTTQALRDVAHLDWGVRAAGLDWSCYDTAVHVAGDFTAYAAQLTGRAKSSYVPFEITADPGTTPEGLVEVITATGGLLSAAVRAARPGDRAWHPYGSAGADGFAAMGIVEALLHTHDILAGLGVHGWEACPELSAQVLDRLFPHVPRGNDAWRTLLWATGRGELPDLPRQTAWRWYADPVPAEGLLLCEISPALAADLAAGGTGGFAWTADGPADGTRIGAGHAVKAREDGTHRPGWGAYALVRTEDRRAIGAMGFHAAPDAEGGAEIGYDLVPSARGRGFATHALKALTAWAFAHPGFTELRAVVAEDNTPSHAVLARAGFEAVGAADGQVRYAVRAPRD
ncbi:GNAT family N-acetyltransferase [Streptomyces sp. NPDC091268]|uniref:GNAT family N-acetyltransferase n=1 Tax=Streptomyces sp. NPDC091268 TaxID=3365979 RepID=UPI003817EB30